MLHEQTYTIAVGERNVGERESTDTFRLMAGPSGRVQVRCYEGKGRAWLTVAVEQVQQCVFLRREASGDVWNAVPEAVAYCSVCPALHMEDVEDGSDLSVLLGRIVGWLAQGALAEEAALDAVSTVLWFVVRTDQGVRERLRQDFPVWIDGMTTEDQE